MDKVGIIINPYSGKDIRRFTSSAWSINNSEKGNIAERMILSMSQLGIHKVYLMPDNSQVNQNVASRIDRVDGKKVSVSVLDFIPNDQPEDTLHAMQMMEDLGIGCMIIIGGDGTCRLAAKAGIKVPIFAISTGTNNVYPQFEEGTSIGCAAAYLCQKKFPDNVQRDKLIRVFINCKFVDTAIVDAVISFDNCIGSRAIWNTDEIDEIIVCRTKPYAIGFSSIIGCQKNCGDDDPYGWRTKLDVNGIEITPLFGAGQVISLRTTEPTKMPLDHEYVSRKEYCGTIALDGERTVIFREGDQIKIVITRDGGLYKVNPKQILLNAVDDGFFIKR
jgi:predicted polyphosphate/ATP-dependent NAD kinase